MTARIFEIKRFAVHDGDGIRTTVFFKGCPLKCVWCHNPEGISFDVETAFYEDKCIGCGECARKNFAAEDCLGEARVRYGKDMTVQELLPLLLEDIEFYENSGGGVTLSGGECLCQGDFCAELLKKLKEAGINTAVDTCGFVPRETFDKILPYTDTVLYDVKAIDENVHIKCTGRPNAIILSNLLYVDSKNKPIEVRIPYVPDFNSEEIEKIAQFLCKIKNLTGVRILPYHGYASSKYLALNMENTLPQHLPTEEEITKAMAALEGDGLRIK